MSDDIESSLAVCLACGQVRGPIRADDVPELVARYDSSGLRASIHTLLRDAGPAAAEEIRSRL
ncbi:MAG: hypothetical protein JO265_16730, partial [Acidimicrobiia bacterium]|nr:hypothetical protein [Acidimicrobiia bacterium]